MSRMSYSEAYMFSFDISVDIKKAYRRKVCFSSLYLLCILYLVLKEIYEAMQHHPVCFRDFQSYNWPVNLPNLVLGQSLSTP